jgi:hypothetical protein
MVMLGAVVEVVLSQDPTTWMNVPAGIDAEVWFKTESDSPAELPEP